MLRDIASLGVLKDFARKAIGVRGRWCVIGGLAFVLYGVQPRVTDLDIASRDEATFLDVLSIFTSMDLQVTGGSRPKFVTGKIRGVNVDPISDWIPKASWGRIVEKELDGTMIYIADPYDLIVLKDSYHELPGREHKREQDVSDVRSVWELNDLNVSTLRSRLSSLDQNVIKSTSVLVEKALGIDLSR